MAIEIACTVKRVAPIPLKMKQKNLIPIIVILLFAACQEITKDDIQGDWYVSYDSYNEAEIEQMTFSEEKVEWADDYLFKQSGTYQIENNELIIKRIKDSFEIRTKIKSLVADTLLVFDSLAYHRNTPFTNFNYDEYDLIGVATNRFLSEEDRYFGIIHYYKSEENELRIRLGQKIANYEDIPLFLEAGHSMKTGVLVFLGEGVTLKDLKELYIQLDATNSFHRVWLTTKKEGVTDYHAFYDKIEIWRDELENHSKIKIPLSPPPLIKNKEDYLAKDGKEIKIDKIEDIEILDKLAKNNKYVISINQNMSIENYLKIKSKYKELRRQKYQIKTEIEQR